MSNLKDAFENPVGEQTVISKISTWPWHTGTVGVLVTTLLLPIFLWLIRRILDPLLLF